MKSERNDIKMAKSIISEGKTTAEAIENGLKQLKISKDKVDIKVLGDVEKRSFFSILEPRVVKVELTLKEEKKKQKEINLTQEEQEKAKQNLETFLDKFVSEFEKEEMKYEIKTSKEFINIDISSENIGFLIGYRGETLYSLQNILTAIAGKGINNKVRVILNIQGYKQKREKALQDLAQKVAKTVIKTGKSVKLEPMQAYERKIIHSALQGNSKVETISVGEEPHRRVIVSLKLKNR